MSTRSYLIDAEDNVNGLQRRIGGMVTCSVDGLSKIAAGLPAFNSANLFAVSATMSIRHCSFFCSSGMFTLSVMHTRWRRAQRSRASPFLADASAPPRAAA